MNMSRGLIGLILCLLVAQPAVAVLGFCNFSTPTCEPETCCNGTYWLEMFNSASVDKQVTLYVRIWNCVPFETSCSSLPTGTPDVEQCIDHTIPANTDCNDPDVLSLGAIGFPCNCGGTNGTGTHLVHVEMWPDCEPVDCDLNECSGHVDSVCTRRNNELCRLTPFGLLCCCD